MKNSVLLKRNLLLLFFFVLLLLVFRIFYTGTLRYVFILWNLFLAWIPFQVSAYMQRYTKAATWKKVSILFTWLVFFPNALYLVTDLIHLRNGGDIPVWFDSFFLYSASLLGMFMAYISLVRTEEFLKNYFSKKQVNVILGFIFILSGFGVYLGRIERWNSWDLVQDPLALAKNMLECIAYPQSHAAAWMMSFISATLVFIFYNILKNLPVGGHSKPHFKNQGLKRDT